MSLNEDKILSGKFVFVSYSHKDQSAVKADMSALLDLGVRVWFDENMRLGDNWSQIAKSKITHEKCVGVIFYNSANSFVSSAVQLEQELTMSRVKEGNFRYWSVNIEPAFLFYIFTFLFLHSKRPSLLLNFKLLTQTLFAIWREKRISLRLSIL